MSLDFICGSLPGEGDSKSKGHNGSWHVGGSARRLQGSTRECGGGRGQDLDSKCDGKPAYKEETGPILFRPIR